MAAGFQARSERSQLPPYGRRGSQLAFRRTDLDVGDKIKYHQAGVVCYDAEALKSVLKLAYHRCIDWTDFIRNTRKIVQHAPIDGNYFESSYDEALRSVREELEREAVKSKPEKEGLIGYAAGKGATALEKDGMRGEIPTKMVMTFETLDCAGRVVRVQDLGNLAGRRQVQKAVTVG